MNLEMHTSPIKKEKCVFCRQFTTSDICRSQIQWGTSSQVEKILKDTKLYVNVIEKIREIHMQIKDLQKINVCRKELCSMQI